MQRFEMQRRPCILRTQSTYVFDGTITMNGDYFPKEH